MSYRKGQWLAICDRCGMQFLSNKLTKTWDGLMVDARCWEPRHPQEFVRGIPDELGVAWVSPDSAEINISPFDYIDAGYWDQPSVVTGVATDATYTTDRYLDMD